MCADCPVTVYDRGGTDRSEKRGRTFKEMSMEEIERKRKDWQQRYGNGKHIVNLRPDR